MLRIGLTGGGSGGHIFPLLAVAEELKKVADAKQVALDMRYFGNAPLYKEDITTHGVVYIPVLSSKLRRYWAFQNFVDVFKFGLSIMQLLWKLFWFMPDVIFSKGGPGAFPVVLVGWWYRIPVILHESDSMPGLTNQLSARFARQAFLGFASAADYFKNIAVEVVGNPVRSSLFNRVAYLQERGSDIQKVARVGFGLDENTPTLFIYAGSQGAERLNAFILENIEILLQKFQIIHHVGENNITQYTEEFRFASAQWNEAKKKRYVYKGFFKEDIVDAYCAADILVARAGAGSIFEIAAFGKPSILIPLPDSAHNHQIENAHLYSQTGAALVIQEQNLLSALVLQELEKLSQDSELRARMGVAAQTFYKPDAAKTIARYLLLYAR
ncbi:MAG: UDP-N-acetylglucosamine--N-acetylmuramyl-(pentapeptide) pyrophosphoryl-undecaprenol N-acetylglucosamine transferase [bacterium]|nr:UDP-N-acetylglucosamine--N-acetylmuramyl-(pentapeptide) pyrophosphoryl-undecaprenol N-acetylglucosamine transferase [bacterium]